MMFRVFFSLFCGINLIFAVTLDELSNLIKPETSGDFIQKKTVPNLDFDIKSSGKFEIKNKELLWSVEEPMVSKIKVNKDGVFELNDNVWNKISSNGVELFLDILELNFTKLQKEFEINLNGNKSDWEVFLKPKGKILGEIFTQISIFGDKNIKKMVLFEKNGEKTINEFNIK